MRGDERVRGGFHEVVADVSGRDAKPLGWEREEDGGARGVGDAACARVEEVLYGGDFALGVEQSLEGLGRRRRRVERHVGEGLGHSLRAVGALEFLVVQPPVPLEVVGGVEAARVLRENLRAVACARMAEIGLAVDDGLAVRDGKQEKGVEGAAAAGRAHDDAAVPVRL